MKTLHLFSHFGSRKLPYNGLQLGNRAKYVVHSRLSFASTFIVTDSPQFRTLPYCQVAVIVSVFYLLQFSV